MAAISASLQSFETPDRRQDRLSYFTQIRDEKLRVGGEQLLKCSPAVTGGAGQGGRGLCYS
jgi:hypothetical protein